MVTRQLASDSSKESRLRGVSIPNKIAADILRYKKSGAVLDLGVGPGRNALFLASSGFDVTGIDIDSNAIGLFRQKATDADIAVKAELADIREYLIAAEYDVIISTSVLHFVADPERVIQNMKTHTKEGGLNVISVFTKENPDKRFAHLFEQNELRQYYDDWEILQYKEYLTDLEQHDDLKPHRHFVAEIMARRG